MKRCIKCQHELADSAKFCTYCGTRQPDAPIAPIVQPATPVVQPAAPTVQPASPAVDPAVLLTEAVGKQEVINEVQRLVAFYNASRREGRLRQRPEMDMLVLGNSGTGKTFLISIIHQLFLANGIVTHPRIKKVDASEYNQWIGTLNEKTVANFDTTKPNLADRTSKIVAQDSMSVERPIEYGIAGGVGLEFSINKVGHFLLEGRYYYGLGDIFGNSKRDYFGRSNLSNIVIKMTYLFDIRRSKNSKIK